MYKKHITTQLDEQTATPVKDAKNTGLYTKKGKDLSMDKPKKKWAGYKCVCMQCSKEYATHYKGSKYCSHVCQGAARAAKPLLKICEWCSKEYDARKHNKGRGIKRANEQKYCSRACMARQRATYYHGKIHHKWNGGQFFDNGYIRLVTRREDGSRYMPMQHRVFMLERLGREYTQDEVVHHINRNRSDNDINNLQVMTRSGHSKYHYEQGHYF